MLGELDRQHLGQHLDPAFRRAIGDAARAAELARHRGDRDDPPARRVGAHHRACGRARREEAAEQVGAHDVLEGLEGDLEHGAAIGDPCIADRDPEWPEACLRLSDRRLALRLAGDIHAERRGGEARRRDFRRDPFRRLGLDVGDQHRGAVAREPLGDPSTDPRSATGDERRPAREPHAASSIAITRAGAPSASGRRIGSATTSLRGCFSAPMLQRYSNMMMPCFSRW